MTIVPTIRKPLSPTVPLEPDLPSAVVEAIGVVRGALADHAVVQARLDVIEAEITAAVAAAQAARGRFETAVVAESHGERPAPSADALRSAWLAACAARDGPEARLRALAPDYAASQRALDAAGAELARAMHDHGLARVTHDGFTVCDRTEYPEADQADPNPRYARPHLIDPHLGDPFDPHRRGSGPAPDRTPRLAPRWAVEIAPPP